MTQAGSEDILAGWVKQRRAPEFQLCINRRSFVEMSKLWRIVRRLQHASDVTRLWGNFLC